MRFAPGVAAVLLMLMANPAGAADTPAPAGSFTPVIDGQVAIPMRDGTRLAATVYRPGRTGQWPTVVLFTPYVRNYQHALGLKYAGAGLVLAVVDVRGRGDSQGEFEPFVHEPQDVYDAVEWAATQPFSTGRVGLAGTSYGGYAQWVAAGRRPPHLVAIEPSAAVLPGWDFPMWKNIGYPYLASWTAYTYGRIPHVELFADSAFWSRMYESALRDDVPLRELDRYVGFPSPIYQRWIAHPEVDDYWTSLQPTTQEFAGIDLPVLSVTGQFDGAQRGALEYYKRHMASATAAARSKHYLLIGPFDHQGTRNPAAKVGGLAIADAGVIDMRALDLGYFRWTLAGGPKPEFLRDRFIYYVLGAEEWRYAPGLEATGAQAVTFHLDAAGRSADSLQAAGSLTSAQARRSHATRYVYDPRRLDLMDRRGLYRGDYLVDDRCLRAANGNALIYVTEPFAQGVEIIGQPVLELQASVDAPDTDFRVQLYELKADGSTLLLGFDMLRARYRRSLSRAELLVPGRRESYRFDGFPWIGRRLNPGSRIAMMIGAPDALQTQRNGNTGATVADERLSGGRPATVRVFQGGAFPTKLILPMMPVRSGSSMPESDG